jgi:chitodextrinase
MTDPSPSSSQGNATSPLNGIVGKTLAALERDFVTVGQRRLRSSYAWLVIGLVGGIVAGILFVASRTPLTPSPSFPLPSLHFPTSSAVTIGPKLVPSSGAYLGTWPKPHNGRRTNAEEIAYLESQIGRTFDIEHEYYRWDNAFPTSATQRIVNEGRIPFISWNARRNDGARNCWKDIANGAQDSWIRERARAVKNFNGGKPLFLVFHHEPEDDVGTCGGDLRGTIEEYKAAWRHIVGIFRAEGATNAVWVWVLMSATFDSGNAAQYYPGDSYVDWIAVDGYNWYPGKPGSQWRSFQKIFEPFYQWSSTAHSSANHTDLTKPLMIAEWGVQEDTATPDPNRKAQWFLDAIPVVKNWPKIKALVYFHSDLAYPWWLDSSSASLSAFKTMAKDPYFNPRTTSGSDTTPPATPQGLSASPGDREVTLSWIANTEPDLNNYAIQWKQSSDSTWTLISGIDKTLTSYTVTGLTNGVSYDFRIRARDTSGNISDWSEPVSATSRDTTPPTISITEPQNGSTVSGTITVSGTASDNVGVTKVNLRIDDTFAQTDDAPPWSFSWDTTAIPDGNHNLTLKAFDAAGNEGVSPAVTVTVANPPATPQGLFATPGIGNVTLSWIANTESDLAAYVVRYKRTSDTSWTYSGDISKGATSYTIRGLTNGTSYDFQIRAKDTSGNKSEFSPTVSATPKAQGLLGTYFNAMNFTERVFSRIDGPIDFDWGSSVPDPVLDADTFSVRWSGKIKTGKAGRYTFFTQSDDGVRLWVNGKLIIDKWVNQGVREWSGTIDLSANTSYAVTLEYYENGGEAVMRLLWEGPGFAKQLISASSLLPQ